LLASSSNINLAAATGAQGESRSILSETRTYQWCGFFSDLIGADQLEAAQLIKAGGAVIATEEQIILRQKNPRKIALIRESATDGIIGTAALKVPEAAYRADLFSKAGVPIAGFEDAPEIGYVVVAKGWRGKMLSGSLVHAIANNVTEAAFELRYQVHKSLNTTWVQTHPPP